MTEGAAPLVGVLGTGRMGSAMARSMAKRGLPLLLWNRSEDKCATLADELGARVAATPAEVAREAAICVSMVADEAAVVALYRDPGGLLEGAGRDVVLVDSSTVPPHVLQGLEADVRATGAGLVDAPVSGSVSVAEAGELTLMVGGDAADIERARPALQGYSKKITHLGPLGTGAAMKLAVNAVIFGLNEAVAEALVLAERAGIERSLAYEVLATSAVGAPFVQYKRASFVEPEATPVAFALALAEKDLVLISRLAAEVGLEVPQATTNLAMIRRAAAGGHAGADLTRVAVELRASADGRAPTATTSD